MTKQKEIETLKAFVEGLPRDSYVRDALEPFLMEFERGVYSDYVPSVSESWRFRREAEAEAAAARAELSALRHEIDQTKREFERYSNSFDALRAKHRELSAMSRRMAEAIEDVANAASAHT